MEPATISKPSAAPPEAPKAVPAAPVERVPEYVTRLVGGKELTTYLVEWKSLAERALAANPYYEPWMLLPAIEHLQGSSRVEFLLVYGRAHHRTKERALIGFFPIEVEKECLHLPMTSISFWQHNYCFLNVPLIDRDEAWLALEAFWRWWETRPFGARVFDSKLLPAEGRFHEIWSDFAIGRTSVALNEYARAALYPVAGGADSYIASAIAKKHLTEYHRLDRKLRQLGGCEFSEVTKPADLEAWIEDFLKVEFKGWKGTIGGTAFQNRPEDADYFRAITRTGFLENRVMLLRFDLNGAPIALKYNLISNRTGFAFKIAFDEEYSKYAPGVLMELENIRRVFDRERLDWMDSCAGPRHPMANRLWSERRMIHRTLYSDSSASSDMIVSALPFLRWFRGRIRRQPVAPHLRISTQSNEH